MTNSLQLSSVVELRYPKSKCKHSQLVIVDLLSSGLCSAKESVGSLVKKSQMDNLTICVDCGKREELKWFWRKYNYRLKAKIAETTC